MPKPETELFNGGLVTSRHAALLNPGELQRADDCVYREKDPAIWRAPGRQALNSTALGSPSAVKGQAHLTFEGSRNGQLLVYVGTAFLRAPLTASAPPVLDALVFSEISGPGSITGAIAGSGLTFTAAGSTYPFTADIVGSRIYHEGTNQSAYVSAVSGESGSTGHYSVITLSSVLKTTGGVDITSDLSEVLAFEYGCIITLADTSGAREETLDVAQYGNFYFAWTGRGPLYNISWRKRSPGSAGADNADVLVARPVGLNPVVALPTVTQLTGTDAGGDAYAWPIAASTGYFWFLITEIFINSEDKEIESAYLGKSTDGKSVGDPVPISVPASTGYGVRLTMPAQVNTGVDGRLSTHWGIYMAGPTTDISTRPSLATFRRVTKKTITLPAGGQVIDLTDTRNVQSLGNAYFPSVNAGSADGRSEMSNASFALGPPEASYATTKSGSSTTGSETNVGANRFRSFKYGGASGTAWVVASPWATRPVVGIRVLVRGAADDGGNAGRNAGYYVYLRNGAGTKVSPVVFGEFGTIDMHVNYHGSETDTWGVAWVTSDFDSDWSVVIGKTGTGSRQRLRIESVGVIVHWSSGTLNLQGQPYRIVSYRDQIGTTVNEPVDLVPPICSTGDFFMGSFVCNDLGDETACRFSLPGRPESFPKPYVLRLTTTKRRDKITCIRTLGQICLVGLENSIKRVNYLPREVDTDLQSGLAQEDLTTDHGIAGPLAAVKFDFPGSGTMLAYASNAGVFLTNGVTSRPISLDLDWSSTVKLSALSSCIFRVYPKDKWLVLYYCPAGATHDRNTRALVFSYAMDKIKEGGFLPCTGPITVSARSACEVVVSGNSYIFTGHETNGKIYQEDYSTTVPSGYQAHNSADSLTDVKINPIVLTRLMYPAGIDRDAREERIYTLFSSYGSTVTASATTTRDSVTVTSSAAFGSVVAGMRVTGVGIDLGTIVIAVGSTSSITLSRAANASGTVTLSFDTGTIAISVRGSSIGEAASLLDTSYASTLTGSLVVVHNDNIKQGLEIQFEKVVLPNGASVDLGTNMRLHQFTLLLNDGGQEQNRSAS